MATDLTPMLRQCSWLRPSMLFRGTSLALSPASRRTPSMRSVSSSFAVTFGGGLLALLLVGEIFGLPPRLEAQQKQGSTPTAAAEPSATTKSFVREAAGGGLAEVELGQLAQEKGTSEAVKSFGARMVQDHGKAGKELRAIAADKGIQLPS